MLLRNLFSTNEIRYSSQFVEIDYTDGNHKNASSFILLTVEEHPFKIGADFEVSSNISAKILLSLHNFFKFPPT
jgi:hypothetical protein